MKNSRLGLLGSAAILAACATAASAAGDVTQGFYISSDTGLNLMSGVHDSAGGVTKLDPGVRWGLEAGYGIKLADQLTLGFEGESGFIWNQLSSYSTPFSGEQEFGGNNYQVPILGNVVLNYHWGKWTGYVGAGGGVDYISLNARSGADMPIVLAGSDFGPAAQGEIGVKYQICQSTEVGVGYKYLTAFSESLSGNRLSEVNNHAISLSLTYHF